MAENDGGTPGANGGAEEKAGKGGNAATDDDGAGDNANENGKGGKSAGDEELKFNQKQVDEIVAKRLARKEKDDAEKAKLTKEQLLEKERDDALNQVKQSNLRDAFISASGLEYGKATRLFKIIGDEIETDDKGKPTNLKDVMVAAKKDWPEFFGQQKQRGGGDGGSGNDGKPPADGNMNAILRRATGRGGV
jgi:hypothetical protein